MSISGHLYQPDVFTALEMSVICNRAQWISLKQYTKAKIHKVHKSHIYIQYKKERKKKI